MDSIIGILNIFKVIIPIGKFDFNMVFFIAILVVFGGFYLRYGFYHARKINSKIQDIEKIVKEKNDLGSLKEAFKNKQDVQALGCNFTESLVENDEKIHSSCLAESFFNDETLGASIIGNRVLSAVPSFLTAIGVLGTFIGLVYALRDLNFSNNTDIKTMKDGISAVIDGTKIAFQTSVWGVLSSLIFNFLEKALENSIKKKISKLHRMIDNKFPLITIENQLVSISSSTEKSSTILDGLSEKIAGKLQEAMIESSKEIENGITQALTNVLEPALASLVNKSSDGNKDLVDNLIQSLGTQSQEQHQALDSVSNNIDNSLNSMDNTMKSFIESLDNFTNKIQNSKEQSLEQASQMSEVVQNLVSQVKQSAETQDSKSNTILNQGETLQKSLETIAQATANATKGLEQSSSNLHEFGVKIQNAGNTLSLSVNGAVNSTQEVAELNKEHSNQIKELQANLKSHIEHFSQMFKVMVDVVKKVESSSNNISQSQGQFTSSINADISSFMDHMKTFTSDFSVILEEKKQFFNDLDSKRNDSFVEQSSQMSEVVQNLVSQVKQSAETQDSKSNTILNQGETLQKSLEVIVKATTDATNGLEKSSSNLKSLSDNMNEFGVKIQNAGNTLSLSVNGAVDSTKNVAELNKEHSNQIADLQSELKNNVEKFSQIPQLMNDVVNKVDHTFDKLNESQDNFLTKQESNVENLSSKLKESVEDLSNKGGELLNNYAEQANSQTKEHLKTWSESTTAYGETMTSLANELSSVVDEIAEKNRA